jgi:hypothetical protein
LSQQQVCFDLQRVRRRYVEQANVHAGEKIGELLAGYRDVRTAAWEQWEATGDPRHLALVLSTYEHERKLLGLDQLSAAEFLTVESVVTLANAIMSAIGRRVNDPELVQQMKLDVLEMLPKSVKPHDTPAALTPAADADELPDDYQLLTAAEPDAADVDRAADPPPDADATAEPVFNGVHGGPDGDLFEPI